MATARRPTTALAACSLALSLQIGMLETVWPGPDLTAAGNAEQDDLPDYALVAAKELVERLEVGRGGDQEVEPFAIIGSVTLHEPDSGSFVLVQPAMACCVSYEIHIRVIGSPPAPEDTPSGRVAVFGRAVPVQTSAPPGRRGVRLSLLPPEDWAIEAEAIVAAERVLHRNNAVDLLDSASTSIFHRAVRESGLEPALRDTAPITILAPIDQAFSSMDRAEIAALFDATNQEALRELVLSHVVQARLPEAQLRSMTGLAVLSHQRARIEIGIGGQTTIGGARTIFEDLPASNGMVHLVNDLLDTEALEENGD